MFCPQCGEERLRDNDLSLGHLARQLVKGFSSVDGKLLRSWRRLLTRPGELTSAHVDGQRRRFLGPLALFLLGNAVFVGIQSLTGISVLSSPLESHLHSQDWSELAQRLVSHRLESRHLTLQAYAPVFDRSATLNAKGLIILMALLFAWFPALLFRRSGRRAGAHIVFALHLYAVVLVLLSASVLIAALDTMAGGPGLHSAVFDKLVSVFNVAVCGTYIYRSVPTVYGVVGWRQSWSTMLLTVTVALLFVAYRFAIFLITFATT
jgi:hypothetical protein